VERQRGHLYKLGNLHPINFQTRLQLGLLVDLLGRDQRATAQDRESIEKPSPPNRNKSPEIPEIVSVSPPRDGEMTRAAISSMRFKVDVETAAGAAGVSSSEGRDAPSITSLISAS
jgi:hypothetical protein